MARLTLQDIDPSAIPVFEFKNVTYDCLICQDDVYDGDSVKVVIMYRNEPMKIIIRLFGIDTPELRPSRKNIYRDKEITKAKISRDALKSFILNKSLQIEFLGNDKYGGRVLGILYAINYDKKISVNQWLISEGHALAYDGGKKQGWFPNPE